MDSFHWLRMFATSSATSVSKTAIESKSQLHQQVMPSNESDTQPSVWHYKPWWCQPWSIVLTGTAIVTASWFLLKLWWVTALVALPILVWMGFFLLIYPRLMQLGQSDSSH